MRRLTAAFITTSIIFAAPAIGENRFSVDQMNQDIDALELAIRTTHPDYTRYTPAVDWESQITRAKSGLESASEAGFYARLARLVALLHDGHSSVIPTGPLIVRRWPMSLSLRGDGVWIEAAAPAISQGVGARIVSISGVPIEDILTSLAPYLPGDNAQSQRFYASRMLTSPLLLRELGLAASIEGIPLVVEARDGTRKAIEPPLPPADAEPEFSRGGDWVGIESMIPTKPLWMEDPGVAYWMRPIAGGKVLYIRYREVAWNESRPFDAFCKEAAAASAEPGVERVVIDLRGNGGGNNHFSYFLLHAMIGSPANRAGRLYVLIDGDVYSAAQNFATNMEKHTYAVFVGEPTGGRPNHFGDAKAVVLPSSQYVLRCSTLRWFDSDPRDARQWIMPDIVVPMRMSDIMAGTDPVLDAAIKSPPGNWSEFGKFWPVRHWRRPSQRVAWPPGQE